MLLQEQALVCHPMHYEGSEGDERECEDHDGFFEPWSREKLEISLSNRLEITVAFLAVKKSDIPGIVFGCWCAQCATGKVYVCL